MQLAYDLHASGLPVFPVDAKKRPTVKGWQQPLTPDQYGWPTAKVGVPVPAGVFLIDLDTYKGVTREAVEQVLGGRLDWGGALIQTTANGGEHYAFGTGETDIKQGADLLGVVGFDTRRAGAGFFVTGDGYTPVGFGVFRLLHPQTLPPLPQFAFEALRRPERTAEQATTPSRPEDAENALQALRHLDPDCSRDEWLSIGFALRNLFADDGETGLRLFHDWSAGDYAHDQGPPATYLDYDHVSGQWDSFKPGGGVSAGTLFHKATEAGWRAPASFDVAAAFGQGAAPMDTYALLVDEIMSSGGNPKEAPSLVDAVINFSGSPAQVGALKGSLLGQLKDGGILSKALKQQLDGEGARVPVDATPAAIKVMPDIIDVDDIPEGPIGRPSASHGANASIMLGEVFGGRVASFHGVLRWWSGREWQTVSDEKLKRLSVAALMPEQCKAPNVSGTSSMLPSLCERREPAGRDRRVYFQNGVLDLESNMFLPHAKHHNNLGALSVPYDPTAPLGEWGAHLDRLFTGLEDGTERIALLQEIIGWSLITDDLNVQKIVAFDGATRAGKGVILEAMRAILGGEKCGTANFDALANGKTQSLFRKHDVLLDFEAEPPPRAEVKQTIGFANKVASNEPVSVQLLNTQTPWTGRLNAKLILACNGIPVMIDDSGASAARFLVLRFNRSFEGVEDKNIGLRMAPHLPAVAAWGVEGLRRLLANEGRFTLPASSSEALGDLKDGNQPLKEFLRDHCTIAPGLRSHLCDLWAAYRLFAMEANIKLCGKHAFGRSLRMTLLGSAVDEKRGIRIGDKVGRGFEGMGVNVAALSNVAVGAFGS